MLLSDDFTDVLEWQRRLTFEVYGRDPRDDEPVFSSWILDSVPLSMVNFIVRHCRVKSLQEGGIASEIDYCGSSLLKTSRTVESIRELVTEEHTESVMALSRSPFESYLYLRAINSDKALFDEKILPKVDEAGYQFARRPDGRINYGKVIHKATGTEKSVVVRL